MIDFIVSYEASIRLSAFLGCLTLLAIWEWHKPMRSLQQIKAKRWMANVALIVSSSILIRFVVPVAAVSMAYLMEENNAGFLNNIEIEYWAKFIIAVVFLDMVIYLQHLNFHELPVLWRFHRVHHSDKDCDVTTGVRFHPIEMVISVVVKIVAIAIIGAPVAAVIVFEVILNIMSMFTHSNIKLPRKLEPILRWIIVTPDMHRIHHSVLENEANSNFSFNLSLWDRLFGTYTKNPETGHLNMKIGLDQFNDEKSQTFFGLLYMPFITKNVGYSINRRDNRQHYARKLKKLNKKLRIEIDKTKENENKLRVAMNKANEANLAKSAFLAHMSHELRTPLTAIIGYSELLQEEASDQGLQQLAPDIQQINTSGKHLLSLINDVLDLSKIEAGELTLENTAFNLTDLIEGCATLLAERARDQKIELTCDVDTKLPSYVKGDPTRLRQVLINLLDNAVKFTDSGEVILRCRLLSETGCGQSAHVYFEVCDTGIGVPAKSQAKLFNAFTQADNSTTRKYGGTGLGLTISQRLTHLMGGELAIDSEEGKGSRFYFDLVFPTADAPVNDRSHYNEDSVALQDARNGLRTPG